MTGRHHVTVLSTRDCHLCDQACADVARITAELGASWEHRDITGDRELMARYSEQVPVILVDGREQGHWRVDERRLRTCLTG